MKKTKSYFFLKFFAKIFHWKLVGLYNDYNNLIYLKKTTVFYEGNDYCFFRTSLFKRAMIVLNKDGSIHDRRVSTSITHWRFFVDTPKIKNNKLKTRYQILKGHTSGFLHQYYKFKNKNTQTVFGRILNWILP